MNIWGLIFGLLVFAFFTTLTFIIIQSTIDQSQQPNMCKSSCEDLNFTYYKDYCDGYGCSNVHCFCFDKENKPIDIGKP